MKSLKAFLVLVLFCFASQNLIAQKIAVKGETVYTMAGDPISNGVVLINNGKIERVGAGLNIPPGYEVHEAAVVTPGLIDAHSVVGLAGHLNQEHDQDQLERSNAIQPELRAIDAFNAREALVKYLLSLGITMVHTGHGPGALISGQTMLTKTNGETVEESLIDSTFALAFTLGSVVGRNYKTPGTRSKGVAMLRQQLIKAADYLEKRDDPEKSADLKRDLKMEALADLLDGKIYALITAHTSSDIMSAIRLRDEFGFKMMLDGAAESYLLIDEIKEADVPVIVHPTMTRTFGDSKNASMETAAKLHEAGISIAFQSGFEGYVPKTRVVLFEAAVAVANGLDRIAALEKLTIDAARMLGISNRVGSLERGKDADVVLFDGDPFEYTTHVTGVIVDGEATEQN